MAGGGNEGIEEGELGEEEGFDGSGGERKNPGNPRGDRRLRIDGEVRGGELGEQEMGSGTWRGCTEMEMEVEGMAARRSGGGGLRWWRRLEDGGVVMTVEKSPWPWQGVPAVVAAAAARRRAAATTTVGLLPRPSLSSHLRGRALLSFFK